MSGPKNPDVLHDPQSMPAQATYLHGAPLGEHTQYIEHYQPALLYPIARAEARSALGLGAGLPFDGSDLWTAHEVSWLDTQGKPQVAALSAAIPAQSPHLIESKSFKLYLNSFNQTALFSHEELRQTIAQDLSAKAGADVFVSLLDEQAYLQAVAKPQGEPIDHLNVACSVYYPDASLLSTGTQVVAETLVSDLLKSNCPVTGQPDWARLTLRYQGPKIVRESLLRYIVSFRRHAGFHEQCVEQIFLDIKKMCLTHKLTVYAQYTRRGGLDINPFRSDFEAAPGQNFRVFRQ